MPVRCEYPQGIEKQGLFHLVPCGQCRTCRRRVVRSRQGQALLEQNWPVYREHLDPEQQHWLTLTYSDQDIPMTVPKPHPLGKVEDERGRLRPFRGPFVDSQRIEITDEGPMWTTATRSRKAGRLLTCEELAEEHRYYLAERFEWSDDDIRDWEHGNYEPRNTVRYGDVQRYLKRLRQAIRRVAPERRVRFLASTEYGGVTDRAHCHIALWGLPRQLVELAYDAWEKDYENPSRGHVYPYRLEAILEGASLMRDKAATYQAKDLVKNRRTFSVTPAEYARERPRVQGSQNPPLGDGAFDWWLEHRVGKALARADETFPDVEHVPDFDRELWRCVVVRQNYGQIHVLDPRSTPPREESFPVMQRWKRRVTTLLGWTDMRGSPIGTVWRRASRYLDGVRSQQATLCHTPNHEGGCKDDYLELTEALRERTREAEEREARRIEQKRSRLLAAGKIRPAQ